MRLYYKETIPADFQPRFFTSALESKGVTFAYEPLNLKIGRVDTPHHSLHLRCKSTIDNYVIRCLVVSIALNARARMNILFLCTY
jgi:hypothetical protein